MMNLAALPDYEIVTPPEPKLQKQPDQEQKQQSYSCGVIGCSVQCEDDDRYCQECDLVLCRKHKLVCYLLPCSYYDVIMRA